MAPVCLTTLCRPSLPQSFRWCLAERRYQRSTGRRGSCRRRKSQTCCPGSADNCHCLGRSETPASWRSWVCTSLYTESWIYCWAERSCCGLQDSRGEWLTQSIPETEKRRDRDCEWVNISTPTHKKKGPWKGSVDAQNVFNIIFITFALTGRNGTSPDNVIATSLGWLIVLYQL